MIPRQKLKLIRDELADTLYHENLMNKPTYYSEITELIFNYPELPTILRNQIIKKNDESFSLMIDIFEKNVDLSKKNKIAIFCSGSGLITEMLKEKFPAQIELVHHYDYRENMLNQNNYADKKICIDLSKTINSDEKYDIIISMGNLRYFSDNLKVYSSNMDKLLTNNGKFFVSEVDKSLVHNFKRQFNKDSYTIDLKNKTCRCLRNTLFYFLLNRYKTDKQLRDLVLQCSTPDEDINTILINLAGFIPFNCFYLIGEKLSTS